MGFILKQLFSLIKLLNSETGTHQIAAGVAGGFILGMTPVLSLQSLLVFLCVLFFRIQLGAALVTSFFFSFVAYLLDPIFHEVGAYFLNLPSLQSIFTGMYNLPILPYTRFYNTIVMGSGVVTLFLAPFVFFVSVFLVKKYRQAVVERFKNSKLWKALQATTLYKWYYKYDELYGVN